MSDADGGGPIRAPALVVHLEQLACAMSKVVQDVVDEAREYALSS
jgi:hypothetical protein